jgi:hypothetical protein
MWAYRQSTGEMFLNLDLLAKGYSGYGDMKNDPSKQEVPNQGPIPRGKWKIVALHTVTDKVGPFVLELSPEPGTETFGRFGFLIHGDSISKPGTASHGCIILPRAAREAIWHTVLGDPNQRIIEVVA